MSTQCLLVPFEDPNFPFPQPWDRYAAAEAASAAADHAGSSDVAENADAAPANTSDGDGEDRRRITWVDGAADEKVLYARKFAMAEEIDPTEFHDAPDVLAAKAVIAARMIRRAALSIALTGAGISTSADSTFPILD